MKSIKSYKRCLNLKYVVLQQNQRCRTHKTTQRLLQKRKTTHTEEHQAKAWTDAAQAVKLYSDNMINRWNKEIDVYLVFVRA